MTAMCRAEFSCAASSSSLIRLDSVSVIRKVDACASLSSINSFMSALLGAGCVGTPSIDQGRADAHFGKEPVHG